MDILTNCNLADFLFLVHSVKKCFQSILLINLNIILFFIGEFTNVRNTV